MTLGAIEDDGGMKVDGSRGLCTVVLGSRTLEAGLCWLSGKQSVQASASAMAAETGDADIKMRTDRSDEEAQEGSREDATRPS